MFYLDGQESMFAQDLQFTKTSPEHLAVTPGRTSKRLSQNSSASSSRKPPMFLFLNRGGGQTSVFSWEKDGASAGEYMTRNIGVYPSAAKESRLSQILEEDVPEKYRLSPKACRGILNRAARRGKELPEELKIALEAQANQTGRVKVTHTVSKEMALTEQTTPDATVEGGERTKATPLTQSTDQPCANAETLGTANPNGYIAEMALGTDCQATNPADRAVTESLPETADENSGGAFHHHLIPSARESMSGVSAYGLTAKGSGEVFTSEEVHSTLASGGGMPGQGYGCAMISNPIGFTNRGIQTGDICETSRAESHGAIPMVMEKNAIGIDHVLISGGTTFQGRGWYYEKSGCLKTQAHGVMTDEKNDDSE